MRNLWSVRPEDMTERQNILLTAFHNKEIEIEKQKWENIINAMIKTVSGSN